MALPRGLTRVTTELPFALRQDIEGYVRSIDSVWVRIYSDAEITPEQVSTDQFLFFAGVWRLWAQVAGQRWLLKNSLDIAIGYGATAITAGSSSYASGSDDLREVRQLHDRYRGWLHKQGFDFITTVHSPRELLWALREHSHAR